MNAKLVSLLFAFVLFFNLKAFNQNMQMSDNQRFIETVGVGQVEFMPDNITYKISISTDDVPMDEASSMDNTEARLMIYKEKMKAVFKERYAKVWDILRSEKINEKSLLESINFDFVAENLSNTNNKDFTIVLKNIETLKNIAVKLRGLPYCSGYIVDMNHANRNDIEMQAKLLCIKDAKAKAEKLCQALNARLGKVLHVIDDKSALNSAALNNNYLGVTVYPPLSAESHESFLTNSNIEKNTEGKLFISQSILVRFALED